MAVSFRECMIDSKGFSPPGWWNPKHAGFLKGKRPQNPKKPGFGIRKEFAHDSYARE